MGSPHHDGDTDSGFGINVAWHNKQRPGNRSHDVYKACWDLGE